MNKIDTMKWIPCDSRSDMEARISNRNVLEPLLTSNTNTWGYIETEKNWYLKIGYANVGLVPQAILVGQRMLVGINECLVGYDLDTGVKRFSYRMPLLFHEFVEITNLRIIIRDEIGFVGITSNGDELWKFVIPDIINNYTITSNNISGDTFEGLPFSFKIPTIEG